MQEQEYIPALEAILFTMGKSVEISKLAYAVELSEERVKMLLEAMQKKYEEEKRGIQLIFLENRVQLGTRAEYYKYLIRVAAQPQKHTLTEAALEVLSIIAYKQPVTRAEVERIRGVKSEHAINKLMEYGLIEDIGRMDAPGKPILFATTEEFLRRFGITSIDTLSEAAANTDKGE